MSPLTGDPKISDASYFLGLAYAAAGDEAKGIHWLERSAQSNPADYHVHYRLARLYANAGRKTEADREFAFYNQHRDTERATEERMRACSAGHFAPFNTKAAAYEDNVVSWPSVEPADDYTANSLLAFALGADQGSGLG